MGGYEASEEEVSSREHLSGRVLAGVEGPQAGVEGPQASVEGPQAGVEGPQADETDGLQEASCTPVEASPAAALLRGGGGCPL